MFHQRFAVGAAAAVLLWSGLPTSVYAAENVNTWLDIEKISSEYTEADSLWLEIKTPEGSTAVSTCRNFYGRSAIFDGELPSNAEIIVRGKKKTTVELVTSIRQADNTLLNSKRAKVTVVPAEAEKFSECSFSNLTNDAKVTDLPDNSGDSAQENPNNGNGSGEQTGSSGGNSAIPSEGSSNSAGNDNNASTNSSASMAESGVTSWLSGLIPSWLSNDHMNDRQNSTEPVATTELGNNAATVQSKIDQSSESKSVINTHPAASRLALTGGNTIGILMISAGVAACAFVAVRLRKGEQ